jgi:hypothetical protein
VAVLILPENLNFAAASASSRSAPALSLAQKKGRCPFAAA